jgi:hypothetical protein
MFLALQPEHFDRVRRIPVPSPFDKHSLVSICPFSNDNVLSFARRKFRITPDPEVTPDLPSERFCGGHDRSSAGFPVAASDSVHVALN